MIWDELFDSQGIIAINKLSIRDVCFFIYMIIKIH